MANVAASDARKPVPDTDVREECLAADEANAHRAGLRASEQRTDAGRLRRGSKEVESPGEKTSLLDGFISRDRCVATEEGKREEAGGKTTEAFRIEKLQRTAEKPLEMP